MEEEAITNGKGGFRASMFIFILSSFENMGFVANMISLVIYFRDVMHFDVPNSANTLTNLMGSTFLLTVVGGFVSDTYVNRFSTCLIFGAIEVLALVMITIQAYSSNLHPPDCGKSSCVKGGVALMFYVSLSLYALGSGGVRGSLAPLGAGQFNEKDPKEAKALASFFNYFLLSCTLGAVVGVTGIVYVSTEIAWYWGFMISTICAFVGFVILAIGKPFYGPQKLGESPILRVVQVIVVAIKNRKLLLPENHEELYEINEKERPYAEEKIQHTNQFSWLDRAAIASKDSKQTPWTICTVTRVEEVKILTRMLPILASTILMNTCLAQLQTFSVQQGVFMEPHLGSIKVPTPSIPVIPLVFMSILLPIYELSFVPFARKITGHPSGITQLQRVGVGLVLSAVSMAVAGFIEVKRRNQFHKNPLKPISLFWLSFQYGIFGIADMFTLVGLLEFFYKEAPAGMRTLSTSFTFLTLSFGYFLSTVFVDIINAVTKRIAPSKQGWLHGININENNVNLFYWFLAILSVLNFVAYLYAAMWYKYKDESNAEAHQPIAETKPLASAPTKEEKTEESEAKNSEANDQSDATYEANDQSDAKNYEANDQSDAKNYEANDEVKSQA